VIDGNGFTITKPSFNTTGLEGFPIGWLPAIELSNNTDNVTITNTTFSGCITGIALEGSSSNINMTENNMTTCDYGIVLIDCSNINIIGNNITYCSDEGIFLIGSCDDINIQANEILGDHYGLWSVQSTFSQSYIIGNDISENSIGLYFTGFNNYIIENNIESNGNGILFYSSSNNLIYYNNFVNNIQNNFVIATLGNQSNIFDVGSQGNYWSNYTTRYPNAIEIGNSGIWNTPYVINSNNIDYYPLVNQASTQPPYTIPAFPSPSPTQTPTNALDSTPTSAPTVPELPYCTLLIVVVFGTIIAIAARAKRK
jgi:parallel beta-helix repeat protein